MYKYTLAAGRTYVLNGPGAIVKKITFKKGIDFCGKIIIIISVKGKSRYFAVVSPQGSKIQKSEIYPLTTSEKSDTI